MIGIRVDANDDIAMGHIMRCISIANQLGEKSKIIFIISELFSKKIILDNGYKYVCLDNKYDDKENEIELVSKIIDKYQIDRLLIDSYQVTYKYMYELRKKTKIIYIDDMNAFAYPADLIVNYTYQTEFEIYEKWKYKNVRFLLGSKYVPLRSEFAENRIEIKECIDKIFITTGGSDNYNVICNLLRYMQSKQMVGISKKIVVGKFYKHMDELELLVSQEKSSEIYKDISNIQQIMKECDIAISAGGTTLAEICACGIPAVCFSMADNQMVGTQAYARDGLMFYAGDIRHNMESVIQTIVNNVLFLSRNRAVREKMAAKAKAAIDGQGAKRIACEINAMEMVE